MGCNWEKVSLGATGLRTAPLGLAAGYGVSERDVLRAFERGINYFYWGSLRRGGFANALRTLAPQHREQMIVTVQSYSRFASLLGLSVDWALRRLKMDYADFLLLGWWNHAPPERLLDAALKLKEKGRVRHLMISCHHRPSFQTYLQKPALDALMVRYNASHTGAETDVFPYLNGHPVGLVSYTATRWGTLLDPRAAPAGERPARGSDCYRFVLTNPHVQLAMMGPKNSAELDEALAALDRGPMTQEELAWMRRIGQRARDLRRLGDAGKV